MATILFYEKPGCGGNARQRTLLEAAGHRLIRRDLLAEPWTSGNLQAFLGPLPVPLWFNRAHPRVKQGAVVPEALDAEAALQLLLDDPLLIRRPLLQREDGARLVGFDPVAVDAFVGMQAGAIAAGSLEGCAAPPLAGACP